MSATSPSLRLSTFGFFFAGGHQDPSIEGSPMTGQMYVEYYIPEIKEHPCPIIMIHGGAQTGTNFTGTPDGREGWAQYFVRRGYSVYVVDQVARGRSPHWSNAFGPVDTAKRWNALQVERRFSATAKHRQWPQASLQNQFPGSGEEGDDAFSQFYASQFPAILDFAKQQEINRDALIALVERIGKSILLTHSQAGTFGWLVADRRPDLVAGIVAIEPNGPPLHRVLDGRTSGPWYADDEHAKAYGLTDAPLTYDPPVSVASPLKFVRQSEPDADDLVCCWKQADPPARLSKLATVPIVIVVGEASYHAAYDHCTSIYLRQAGVAHTFIRLADLGIRGNGHMMMVERNNQEIAAVIERWLRDIPTDVVR